MKLPASLVFVLTDLYSFYQPKKDAAAQANLAKARNLSDLHVPSNL
jgi:hypothetical protein